MQSVLSREQANEVLRYWLASLQLDEALSTRPRARAPLSGVAAPRLDAPSPGHEYFKVPLDGAVQSLLGKRTALHKPLDAELGAFFETWLVAQYRRGQDRELAHMLTFPVVHLPRGELAGLLRCSVSVRFGDPGGEQFNVPSRSERRRKAYPPPPSEVRLGAVERSGRQWPFFVDTRLLHQQLGVARESIDALFAELRKQPEVSEPRMLSMVCDMLETELREAEPRGLAPAADGGAVEPPPAVSSAPAQAAARSKVDLTEVLGRITAAMGRLLARRGGRARVYPVGIVLDGTRAKSTWYLQRELQLLLEDRPEVAWDLGSCLGDYLTGSVQPPGMAVQRTLFPGPPLSPSQRLAAERSWGSRLTAVQGPPGTGKTTLILHLAAEALVRQVDKLADKGVMGAGLLVVASTNNRAVDNVVDPLIASTHAGLPLALRAGSQRVCEHLLAPQLARAREWLDRAQLRPAAERAADLATAIERFKHVRAQLAETLAPRALAFEAQTQRNRLRLEFAQLQAADAGARDAPAVEPRFVPMLRAPLAKVHKRLRRLAELCEAMPGLAQLAAVDRHYRSIANKHLPALEQAIATAGLSIELGLPPDLPPSTDPAALMEAWEVAAEAALARVEALQLRLERASDDARSRERLRLISQKLEALGPDPQPSAETDAEVDSCELQRALFEAAVTAREAWAAAASDELVPVVGAALDAARNENTLRPLWSDEPKVWQLLRQLFGVWGCTLLSLGNCFPAQRDGIARLIIDEAGQCHPTYAISGLLRSRSALIIGDVHQLEPVIDLEPDDDERVIQSCKLSLSAAALAPYRVHSQARCSVQALADRAVQDRPRLTDHFRCQPEIIAISDALCGYGLRVHTLPRGPAVPLPFLLHPVSFVDVSGEQERLGGSWHNPAELALTLELVQALLAAGTEPNDLAIITPYRGQLEQLRKQIVRMGVPIDHSIEMMDLDDPSMHGADRGAALGTVHRFQGGERSIVIFTSVVTRRASLSFLDQRENLLNVAVSRARHRFIAVGSRAVLAAGQRTGLLTRAAEPLAPEAFRNQLELHI